VNSTNPNRGHHNPSPTVTYGTKSAAAAKTEERAADRETETARKGGRS
jgi:hypothetical protein